MLKHDHGITAAERHGMAGARYLTSVEVANLRRLLEELRDTTQSRSSHAMTCGLLAELGRLEVASAKPE